MYDEQEQINCIVEYTGKSEEEVRNILNDITMIIAKDFNENVKNPNDRNEVENWYRNTPYYIYDLSKFHFTGADGKHPSFYETVVREVLLYCKQNKNKRILDYGCGIGDLCFKMDEMGHEVSGFDFKSKTLDFAIWKGKKIAPYTVDFVNEKETHIYGINSFDMVSCIDVIEHMYDIEYELKTIYELLKPGGSIIFTTTFPNSPDSKDIFPMHLEKWKNFEPKLWRLLEKIGFQRITLTHWVKK